MSDYRIRLSGLDFGLRLTADPGLEDELPTALEATRDIFLDIEEAAPDAEVIARADVHRLAEGWRLTLEDSRSVTYPDPNHVSRSLEAELEKAFLEHPTSRLLLHGGSVVRGHAACAFMASADRGKTTSALHCLELGAGFLTEEVTTVDVESWEVAPHLRSLSTGSAHLERLSERFPLKAGRLKVFDGLEARYVPSRLHRAPAQLRVIVIPTYDPDGVNGLTDANAADVLTEMLGYCFEPRQDHEQFVDGMIALLCRCRILRLRYRDSGAARDLLTGLTEMLDAEGGLSDLSGLSGSLEEG